MSTIGPRKWSAQKLLERRKRATELRRARNEVNSMAGRVAEIMLVRQVIDSELIGQEHLLTTTAWLPYGYMSAFERTELFCLEYERAYKHIHEKYMDYSGAENLQPVDPEYARNELGEMSSLWKARQYADMLGAPYPLFIRVAMDTAVQHQKFSHVPRPNQLLSDKQIDAIRAEWERTKDVEQLFGQDWDPRFFHHEHRADPPRLAARNAVIERIKTAPPGNAALALANHLGDNKALSEAEARAYFNDEIVDEALLHRRAAAGPAIAPTARYRPPCLGMKPTTPPVACSACSGALLCRRTDDVVRARLVDKCGTDEPKKALKRQQARDRQQRHRAKKRAEQLAASQPVR